jgi:hypothetical protein
VRHALLGEPGIGKSTLIQALRAKFPSHHAAYIDCASLDLGDTGMPVVNHADRLTTYYPNSRFKLHTGEPVIIMLDEFGKAGQAVQNMLHPLLEEKSPRFGDVFVHDESIIFLTSNLGTDGVGDSLKAHTRNRIVELPVSKPDADQWLLWAAANNQDGVIMGWVKQYPNALASYLEGNQDSNPYIFNPKKVQSSFVTPRSLSRASAIVSKRHLTGREVMTAQLMGAVGQAAARDMMAYVDYADKLPSWESIIGSPNQAIVPESPGACAVLIYGAIGRIKEKKSLAAFMNYIKRMPSEWQAAFGVMFMADEHRRKIAVGTPELLEWAVSNADIL